MTNEEKSREYQAFIERNNPSAEAYGFYNAYLSACEWKDQQFKECLEKLEDECDKEYKVAIANNDDYEVGKAYGRLCVVIEIINELFGETEEVDHSNNDE